MMDGLISYTRNAFIMDQHSTINIFNRNKVTKGTEYYKKPPELLGPQPFWPLSLTFPGQRMSAVGFWQREWTHSWEAGPHTPPLGTPGVPSSRSATESWITNCEAPQTVFLVPALGVCPGGSQEESSLPSPSPVSLSSVSEISQSRHHQSCHPESSRLPSPALPAESKVCNSCVVLVIALTKMYEPILNWQVPTFTPEA